MTERLRVTQLSFAFQAKRILDNLSFGPLQGGTVTALLGSNAAGKSTLLRCISGELAGQGSILVDQHPLEHWPRQHPSRPAYVPQEFAMGSSLRVFEAVLLACKQDGGWRVGTAQVDAVSHLLQLLDITPLAGRMLFELSGGQRQLVSIAQALIRQPHLLLLDEPTSALDLQRQCKVFELLRSLARQQGLCVVMAIHDLSQALRYADQVLILHQGRVAASGPPHQVITPQLLAEVYGVQAHLEQSSAGHWLVVVERALGTTTFMYNTLQGCSL
ncbi:MAG: ABC transporter ATP-binding protein [Pseudomonas sp.]